MTEVTASILTLRSSSRPAPRKTNAATQWLPPVGLIALSLIPVLAVALTHSRGTYPLLVILVIPTCAVIA
jgi:hypothetical protein